VPPSRRLTLEYVSKVALTDAIQDYLKEIYKLQSESGPTSVSALARRQSVSPASASAMVKKLAALELADHQPYGGVVLTASGERVAIEIIRHHRLLEHVISEELEARIDRALGFPTHDPHGDPIPDAQLKWPRSSALG